ncbi:helix-turn-helix domain-containing protein [Streptomyces sp. NPDC101194]|uniref:helix-turn-helix domain-containing protein n=1 Tax=Streptomyces sp. NPDC101194 TaxID=3366127 RepID=UPI0037F3C3A0
MTEHRNASLTPEGRLRLCLRVAVGRPIAHVAAEAGISRRCLAKWYARWREHGDDGILDQPSRPAASPTRTRRDIADLVEALRRRTKVRARPACCRTGAAARHHRGAGRRAPHPRPTWPEPAA